MAYIYGVAFLGLLLTGFASAQPVPASQCNLTALVACMTPFQVWTDGFSQATISASNFSTACSNYTATAACVLNTAKCPDSDPIAMANWVPSKTFVGYSCGYGQDGYLASAPCLAGNAVAQAMASCVPGVPPGMPAMPSFPGQSFPAGQSMPGQTVPGQSFPTGATAQPSQNVSGRSFATQTVPAGSGQTVPSQNIPGQGFSSMTTGTTRAISGPNVSSQTFSMQSPQTGPTQTFSGQTFSGQTFPPGQSPPTGTTQFPPGQTNANQALPADPACAQMNGLVSCVVLKAKSTCGDAAARFFYGALPTLLPGFNALPNCAIINPLIPTGSGAISPWTSIPLGSGAISPWISIPLLLASALLASLVVWRHRSF